MICDNCLLFPIYCHKSCHQWFRGLTFDFIGEGLNCCVNTMILPSGLPNGHKAGGLCSSDLTALPVSVRATLIHGPALRFLFSDLNITCTIFFFFLNLQIFFFSDLHRPALAIC